MKRLISSPTRKIQSGFYFALLVMVTLVSFASFRSNQILSIILLIQAGILLVVWLRVIRNIKDVFVGREEIIIAKGNVAEEIRFENIRVAKPLSHFRIPIYGVTYTVDNVAKQFCFLPDKDVFDKLIIEGKPLATLLKFRETSQVEEARLG